jgi:hypothetical protein
MTLWIHLKWIGLVYNDLLREYVELSINARNLLTNVHGVFICVQTGSGAHPASCTMGTGGSFPGGEARQGRDADHSPHIVPRS